MIFSQPKDCLTQVGIEPTIFGLLYCIVEMFIYRVFSWDTGEVERMSPWDLEPIPDGMFVI
jgi:hypothetical protein